MRGLPMSGRTNTLIHAVLICVPVLAGILWIACGRENLTKTGKAVTSTGEDIFGDPSTTIVFEPGPIYGYYVGLDVFAGTTALSGTAALVLWWRRRRRRAHSPADRMTEHVQA